MCFTFAFLIFTFALMRSWQIRGRNLSFDKTLVMGILNVTPDSFSDGGSFLSLDDAHRQAERMIAEGADMIDVGGESTRPGSREVPVEIEISRTSPVIEAIASGHEIPISIDTTKFEVAKAAIDAGAHIINDISGLRFDPRLAVLAAETGAGIILMHSLGTFESMHSQMPVGDIFAEVTNDFYRSVEAARSSGVSDEQVVLDVGIGFGKTPEQNLELIAKLGRLRTEFPGFAFLVGASRKSFIGKLLDGSRPDERLSGSVAAAAIAAWNGANIVRVHDVKATVGALTVVRAIADQL